MPGMILDCFCMILKMLLTCPGPSAPCSGVYFPWRFHLASHGYSCSPELPVKLPKGFTGSHHGVSWVSLLASGGTFPHGPCILPLLSCFPEATIPVPDTCQALHIYVFAYCILRSLLLLFLIPGSSSLPAPTSLMSSSWS